MAESLTTADGAVLTIDPVEAQFAAAQGAPPAERPGMAAPPRRPPEPAPDKDNAPYGWTWADGEWRPKKTAGRPSKKDADRPRVTEAPPVPTAPGPGATKPAVDYLKVLRETCESAWFVLASAPVPEAMFGYHLGGLRTRLRVQAYLIEANLDALAGGVNLIAANNTFVRRGVARLAAGEAGLWVLPAVMLLAPFAAQTGQLWTGQLGEADLDTIAAQTEADAKKYVAELAGAAMSAAAAHATAAHAAQG